MILLASNNATSTLAGPISPTSTALNVQSGSGAEFPSPGSNEYFTVTMNDAATGLLVEIMWCTNVTGDTLTVQRGKEGTTAQSWLANDLIGNLWTAGSMGVMAQQGQLQSFVSNQSADTGSVNAIVASLTPAPANLAGIAGAPIIITSIAASNTGTVTLNLNGFGAQSVINPNDTGLSPGQLTVSSVAIFIWSVAQNAFILVSTSLASSPPSWYAQSTPGSYAVPVPTGVTRGDVVLVGGGGGGGGCDGTHNSGGGGAGGTLLFPLVHLVPGQNLDIVVGAAGAGGVPGATGSTGGSTTLQVNGAGTVYTAPGGTGGVGGSASPSGGAGGVPTNGNPNLIGGFGGDGSPVSVSAPAGNGAPGYLGMGQGRGAAGGGTPANATAPGAGGGGTYATSSTGGNGGGGFILVNWRP